MSSFNSSSTNLDNLFLQTLMGRLQIRPPLSPSNTSHNDPLHSRSLEELLLDAAGLGDYSFSDEDCSDADDSDAENRAGSKSMLAKEESRLEKEIIKIVLSGKTDSLKPNSGQAVTIGEHHICVGFHEESGSDYRVWEWHGHVMLFDEENGYTPEYIYGNYFERLLCKPGGIVTRKQEKEEDVEKVEKVGSLGLRELIEDGDSTGSRILHRNVNASSPNMPPRMRGGLSNSGPARGNCPGASSSAPPRHLDLRDDGFVSAEARAWYDLGKDFVMERRFAPEVIEATGVDILFARFGLSPVLKTGGGLFCPELVREFYANAQAGNLSITSFVRHHPIEITPATFSSILRIPVSPDDIRGFTQDHMQRSKSRWLQDVGRRTQHRGEEDKDVLPFTSFPTLLQRLLLEILSHQIRPQSAHDASDEDCALLDYFLSPSPPTQRVSFCHIMFGQLHKEVSYLRTKKKKITPIFPFFIWYHLYTVIPAEAARGLELQTGERPVTLQTVRRWGFMRLDDGTWVKGRADRSSTASSTAVGPSTGATPSADSDPPSTDTAQGEEPYVPTTAMIQIPAPVPISTDLQTQLQAFHQMQQQMHQWFESFEQTQQRMLAEQSQMTQRLDRSDELHAQTAQQTAQLMQHLLAQIGQGSVQPPPPPQ